MKFPRFSAAGRHGLEVGIPPDRMRRVRGALRRRLSDDVEDVFRRACADNDLQTATDLFAVLEAIHLRLQSAHGRERRVSDRVIRDARDALERCDEISSRLARTTEARASLDHTVAATIAVA
jgi:hypothetical protein